jgi:hypothetical protein
MSKLVLEVERHDGMTAITIKHKDIISITVDSDETRILLDDEVADTMATRIRNAEDAADVDQDEETEPQNESPEEEEVFGK